MTGMDRFARWLAPVALAMGLLLPLASLPVFAFGYWDKAEPLIVLFHAGAALASLAVAVALLLQPHATLARITHPYVLLPLAVGLWSLVIAPTTRLPLLSILGAPQSGYGALWFFDGAAWCACALLVADHPRAWTWLTRLAVGIALVIAIIKGWDWWSLHHGGSHLLIFVAAYYGWLALALPLPTCRGEPQRLVELVGLGAVAGGLAVASQSMTAVGLLIAAGVAAAIPTRWPHLATRLTPRGGAALVAVAAGLPWLVLHTMPWLLEKESLRDRFLVHRLVQAHLKADPAALVLGHGWGRTQDAFHTWLNVSGERLWSPTWTFLSSDYFHSHNWALEALHAAGLPGLALVLAGFVAIPVFARADCRPLATAFALAATLFHGVWFPLSLSVPLTAMALAGVADRIGLPTRPALGRVALPVMLALALVQAGAAAALLSHGLAIGAIRAAWQEVPPRPMPVPADFRGSDLAAAEAIRDQLADFAVRARTEPTAPIAAATLPMLAFIDARAPHTTTLLLLTTGLTAMTRIHVTGDLAFLAAPERMATWRRWLERSLALAPGRSDLAIPFLTAAIAQGRVEEAADVSANLLVTDLNDPVGLHYQGLIWILDAEPEHKAEGLRLVRAAIDNGLERFMPVDPAVKAAVGLPQ